MTNGLRRRTRTWNAMDLLVDGSNFRISLKTCSPVHLRPWRSNPARNAAASCFAGTFLPKVPARCSALALLGNDVVLQLHPEGGSLVLQLVPEGGSGRETIARHECSLHRVTA